MKNWRTLDEVFTKLNSLSKEDQEDFFELWQNLIKVRTEEERKSIYKAIDEILDNKPIVILTLDETLERNKNE